jgi:hypothetical protein
VGVRIPLLNPRTSALLICGVRSGEGVVLKSDREVQEILGLYWRFSSGVSTWFKLKRKTQNEVRVKYEQGAFNDYITQDRVAFVVL